MSMNFRPNSVYTNIDMPHQLREAAPMQVFRPDRWRVLMSHTTFTWCGLQVWSATRTTYVITVQVCRTTGTIGTIGGYIHRACERVDNDGENWRKKVRKSGRIKEECAHTSIFMARLRFNFGENLIIFDTRKIPKFMLKSEAFYAKFGYTHADGN